MPWNASPPRTAGVLVYLRETRAGGPPEPMARATSAASRRIRGSTASAPDPRRPRGQDHASPHQQPGEVCRTGRFRPRHRRPSPAGGGNDGVITPDIPVRRFANACWWLLRSLTHDEIVKALVDSARELTGADAAFFASRDGDELRVSASSGLSNPDLARSWRLPVGSGITGWVVAHGQPATVGDYATDPAARHESSIVDGEGALRRGGPRPGVHRRARGARVSMHPDTGRPGPVADRSARVAGPPGGEPRRGRGVRAAATGREGGDGARRGPARRGPPRPPGPDPRLPDRARRGPPARRRAPRRQRRPRRAGRGGPPACRDRGRRAARRRARSRPDRRHDRLRSRAAGPAAVLPPAAPAVHRTAGPQAVRQRDRPGAVPAAVGGRRRGAARV